MNLGEFMQNSVAVLTDSLEFSIFNAVGADVIFVDSIEQALKQFNFVCSKYSLVILSETLAEHLGDNIKKLENKIYPIILSLPPSRRSSGFAIKNLVKKAKEALGIDVFKE